ncbi:phosphatidate cytidylyltransferase [uncultured Sunxiuqinia sp.]|uniref:phosphatidate cytidylyltransferase n=1 Tax=uncultured Sunxiuqinia sp. TaxID=1573825 RepID=UPI0030DBA040|tara:strand:- start:9785 stop:10513 length:729 start_codon:yes stop_codon:yes gene_type:complete
MIQTIYLIILIYFFLGGIGFYLINRKKDSATARKSYTKFATYFFIINLLFFSIVLRPVLFNYLAVVIIIAGLFELLKLFWNDGFKQKRFFLVALVVFISLAAGFFFFSRLQKELILFSFLVLSIFDSFSQITGQLWGKQKLFPTVSPAKTVGGLIGGAIVALASSLLLSRLYGGTLFMSVLLAVGIVFFAFAGDLAASFYKRKFREKDFGNLIPGHGGFLDRFDSLIAGGAWVTFCVYILNF